MNKRRSGILLHPLFLSSKYGCGDLGTDLYRIIDWLKKAGQTLLQVLPLGPTGYGDSPYQSFSAFAGTPYLISFDKLIEDGLIKQNDFNKYPKSDKLKIDYYNLYIHNFNILKIAFNNFKKMNKFDKFYSFCEENLFWLNDYSLFMAFKEMHDGASWEKWDKEFQDDVKLVNLNDSIKETIEFYKYIQWIFFSQWVEFKNYANLNGISIIGDVPIFVSYDSADVWANRELFLLDKNNNPEIIAGVPPDYFSKTGQLWGNPLYNWELMKKNNFKWWKQRIEHTLKLVDMIRIDHFRGFESYWAVLFGEETAINGEWIKAPGVELFNALKDDYGEKIKEIIIAEDLGLITDEVIMLRDLFGFPGMRIFQFADFSLKKNIQENKENSDRTECNENPYLPENYIENCVVYPGTHDNNTLKGWFDNLTLEEQIDIINYLNIKNDSDLNYTVISLLLNSKSDTVIFPIQDILEMTEENRINTPGTRNSKNWTWRLNTDLLDDELAEKLYKLTKKARRI